MRMYVQEETIKSQRLIILVCLNITRKQHKPRTMDFNSLHCKNSQSLKLGVCALWDVGAPRIGKVPLLEAFILLEELKRKWIYYEECQMCITFNKILGSKQKSLAFFGQHGEVCC